MPDDAYFLFRFAIAFFFRSMWFHDTQFLICFAREFISSLRSIFFNLSFDLEL